MVVHNILLLVGYTDWYHLNVRPAGSTGFAWLAVDKYPLLLRLVLLLYLNDVLTLYNHTAAVRVRHLIHWLIMVWIHRTLDIDYLPVRSYYLLRVDVDGVRIRRRHLRDLLVLRYLLMGYVLGIGLLDHHRTITYDYRRTCHHPLARLILASHQMVTLRAFRITLQSVCDHLRTVHR